MNNIFAGDGLKAKFAKLVYDELMKRKYVCYADILTIYYERESGYYDKYAPSWEVGIGELKKAFPAVVNALNEGNRDGSLIRLKADLRTVSIPS